MNGSRINRTSTNTLPLGPFEHGSPGETGTTGAWVRFGRWPHIEARHVLAGLLLAGVAYAAIVFVLFPKWTVDDAYITFRYAENLARTGDLCWNVGERPVEGYTGIALPVALAGAVRLGLAADLAAKVIGVSAFFAGAIAFLLLLKRLDVSDVVGGAFVLLYLSTPALFTHALSGLETTLFLAAVVIALWSVAEGLDEHSAGVSRDVRTAVALLGVGLVRPEGVALAACLIPAQLYAGARTRRERVRASFVLLALFALPAAVYFSWRLHYYGQLLPNTYYAKWHRGFVPASLYDLMRFALTSLLFPALSALALLIAGRASRRGAAARKTWDSERSRRFARGVILPAVAFVVICTVVYLRSALAMNYSGRFFVPMLPILLMCAAVSISRSTRALRHGQSAYAVRAALLVGGSLLAVQIAANVALLGREAAFAVSTKTLLENEHIPAGRFLRTAVPASEWLVVVVDAGAIPYYSGLKTVDFGGLNDAFLARRFIDRRASAEIVDYFYLHRPGAAVFTSRAPDRVDGPERTPITSDPRFADYVLVASYSAPGWNAYYQLVYLRRDLVRAAGAEAIPRGPRSAAG